MRPVAWALAAGLALGLALAASAQEEVRRELVPGLRPGDERPPPPEPGPPPEEPELALPPIAPPEDDLAAGLRVRVERFEITGSTVFDAAQLARAVAPLTGRAITSEELLAARDAVTRLYLDAGYVTSGAVVPDQEIADGVVRLRVVEGELARVEVRGNERFREGYFAVRLRAAAGPPVNVHDLESALRRLQRDPRIERVDATLEPARRLGESRLVLRVREAPPFHLALEGDNDRSPAIGSGGGAGEASLFNLVGWGDALSVRAELSEGLRDVEARVSAPVTPWDTRALFRVRDTRVEIVEEPFDALDIESHSRTWGLELEHPLHRSGVDEVWLGLVGEIRDLDTELLGEDFCFEPDPGLSVDLASCSGPRATVLRASLRWTRRSAEQVFAVRSLVSWGVDAFGASTRSDRDLADGRFVAWLTQAQWARVLPDAFLATQVLLRGDLQLASEPLLSFEQFAMGGRTTVRGYRENRLVTDSGVVVAGELRVPVWRDALGRPRVEVVPFMDVGHGWNDGPDPEDDLLWSAGVGLRLRPMEGVVAEAWWGGELEPVDDPDADEVLQDHGVHLRVRIDAP